MTIFPLTMTGRCWNGAHRDRGRVVHAVAYETDDPYRAGGDWRPALCGATPGQWGNGWSCYPAEAVTCPKCLRKMS